MQGQLRQTTSPRRSRLLRSGKEALRSDGIIDEDRCRERTTVDSAGIDIQTIVPLVRNAVRNRCVTVHDEAAEIRVAREERLSDPEQVLRVLLLK
jgi:hypothetical protein